MGMFWIDAMSGERRTGPAKLATALLAPVSLLYGLLVRWRNRLYDTGRGVHRAACPIVSVGNITIGGTGKTPFVEWVVRQLQALGRSPAVVSRGYGAASSGLINEEAVMLAENCPGIVIECNPDRFAGVDAAVRHHGADCVVLDDGFQHRRLHRDIDIVLIDATRPFGNGRLLPAGILREPLSGLRRARAIVITRSDQADRSELDRLRKELAGSSPNAAIALAVHRPVKWVKPGGSEHETFWVANRSVLAVSGLANPSAFEKTTADLGANVIDAVRFGDHHRYSAADAARIARRANSVGAEMIVTSQKDAVKLHKLWRGGDARLPMLWLRIEMDIVEGGERLKKLLHEAVRSSPCNVS